MGRHKKVMENPGDAPPPSPPPPPSDPPTSPPEEERRSPDLRRSKRKKFNLDVVAIVSGTSSKKVKNEPLSVETTPTQGNSNNVSPKLEPKDEPEDGARAPTPQVPVQMTAQQLLLANENLSANCGDGGHVEGKRKRRSTAPYRDYGYNFVDDLEDEDMRGFIGDNFCTKCPARYDTKHGKNNHMKLHGGEKRRFSCELCDFSAHTAKAGMQHAKMHKAFGVLSGQPSPVLKIEPKIEPEEDEKPPVLLPEDEHLNIDVATSSEFAPTLVAQKPAATSTPIKVSAPPSAKKSSSLPNDKQCPHCPFLGKTAARLKRHYRGHELQRGYVCGARGCGFKCETVGFLKRHYTLHKDPLPWPPKYVGLTTDGNEETKNEERERLRPLAQLKSRFLNEENEKKCNIGDCEFTPITQQSLITHKILMHRAAHSFPKSAQRICSKCGYRAKNALLLKAHKLSKHAKIARRGVKGRKRTFYVKEMVGEVFFTKYVGNSVKPDENLMDESFDSVGDSQQQQQNSQVPPVRCETYHCNLCPYKAVSASRVERHYAKHFVELDFKCEICKYSCRSQEMMTQHERLHYEGDFDLPEPPIAPKKSTLYNSSIQKWCAKRELDERTINDSFTKIAVDGQKIFKCLECPYTSKYRGDIKTHKSRHSTEQELRCTQCSYSAARPVSLRDHMRQHVLANSNLAAKCEGKKIVVNGGKMIGQRWGRGTERVYLCSQCSYFTSTIGCIWRHSRYHRSVPKVHVCSSCTYSSIDKTKMDEHIIIHSAHGKLDCYVRRVNNEGRPIRMITDYDHDPNFKISPEISRVPSPASASASASNLTSSRSERFLRNRKSNSRFSTPSSSSANLSQLEPESLRNSPRLDAENVPISPNDLELSHFAIRNYLRNEKKAENAQQCPDCPYRESDLTLFRLHRDMHFCEGKPRQFACCECNFSVFTANALQAHLRLHSDGMESADNNSSFLRRKQNSRKAEVIPPGAKFYQCTSCSFKTVDDFLFMEHRGEHRRQLGQRLATVMKRNAPKDDYQKPRLKFLATNRALKCCTKCMFRCSGLHQFVAHSDRHGWNRLYKCKMCDYSDSTKNTVDYHETHHHVTKEHTLTDTANALTYSLNQGFVQKPILRQLPTPSIDEALRITASSLKCPLCDYIAHLAPELSFHITQKHGDNENARQISSMLQMGISPAPLSA